VVDSFGLWCLSHAQQRFELVQANIIPGTKALNDAKNEINHPLDNNRREFIASRYSASRAAHIAVRGKR
jgi:hypothetical protein